MAGQTVAGVLLIGAGAAVGYVAFHPAAFAGLSALAAQLWTIAKFGSSQLAAGSNNDVQQASTASSQAGVAVHNAAVQTVTGTPDRCAKAGWKAWLDPYCVALKATGH